MHIRVAAIGGVLALVALNGAAQSAPTIGLLYNTEERYSLTYHCEPVRNEQITCEFVQTGVYAKATYADLPGALDKAIKQFATEKPPTPQECTAYREMLAIVEGKKTAPRPEGLADMSQVEKGDTQQLAKALTTYCDTSSEEAFLALTRIAQERDRRTCKVFSLSFRQTFRQVSEVKGRIVWVAQDQPDGPCGIVQLSRFEPEEVKLGTGTITQWAYIARKAITNPSAELFPGGKCTGFDERSYKYDWRPKEHQLSCDYIAFSPL